MDLSLGPNLIALIAFLGIASALAAIAWGARDLFGRNSDDADAPQTLKRLPRFEEEANPGLLKQIDQWLDRTLYWSGLQINGFAASLLVLLVVLAAGGAAFVATENEMFAAVAGLFGFGLVIMSLEVRKRRRLRRYEEQFPAALDLLARAVRAGESIEQAMGVVGEALREPAGPEFQRCAGQLDLGLSLAASMRSLSQRVDQMDTRIFATTLSVHRDSGGNLPITLERLAEVIRDRMSYQRQLRSVTAAGRYSALLIAVIGPLLFGYFFLVHPEYGGKLTGDPIGRYLLVVAIVSEVVGIAWIMRLLRSDY
ncbi:MAG: type II secretion system F family protein [Pirellulales bacterium]